MPELVIHLLEKEQIIVKQTYHVVFFFDSPLKVALKHYLFNRHGQLSMNINSNNKTFLDFLQILKTPVFAFDVCPCWVIFIDRQKFADFH